MKKHILSAVLMAMATTCMAQTDSTLFKGYFNNKENNIYLKIDFYKQNIKVPGQDIFGEIPGYLGDNMDSRKWLITDASVNGKTATVSIINDYGSEDLTAELTLQEDGSYILKQKKGSNLKIARNRKWVKLPKNIIFEKRK